jgi:hypothetical protein
VSWLLSNIDIRSGQVSELILDPPPGAPSGG